MPPADRVTGPPKGALFYNPLFRSFAVQAVLCVAVVALGWTIAENVVENLARNHLTSGFGFLHTTAGFDISQTLIEYSVSSSTYLRAFWVGLLNTLLVAILGIVIATVIGFLIGIGQLSENFMVSRLSRGYVTLIRNLPLLLQLLFWYNAVLKALPDFRDSYHLWGGAFLNSRGLFLPRVEVSGHPGYVGIAFIVAVLAILALRAFARRRQERTGRPMPVFLWSVALLLGLPLAAAFIGDLRATWTPPVLGRFNVSGATEVLPEFVALLIGLSLYTAAFIAEVVRAGLMSVSRCQTEAAAAAGLRRGQILRLVVIPQATRVIIPTLTNQYLNLTKNSTLAVAIGYPDFTQIFTGTVLNQTGQALEVVAMTLAVYLAISLVTSFAMNVYQARTRLVTR